MSNQEPIPDLTQFNESTEAYSSSLKKALGELSNALNLQVESIEEALSPLIENTTPLLNELLDCEILKQGVNELNNYMAEALTDITTRTNEFMPVYMEYLSTQPNDVCKMDIPLNDEQRAFYNEAYSCVEKILKKINDNLAQSEKIINPTQPFCETPLAKNFMYVVLLISSIVCAWNSFHAPAENITNINHFNNIVIEMNQQNETE